MKRNRDESRGISIRIQNASTSITVQCDHRDELKELSGFFNEVITNMESTENVLTLEEDDPTEAASFLLELIKISQNESKRRNRFWNKSWAQLSTKWLVSEYVTMYAELGSKHIAMMLYNSPPKNHGAFEIYGDTNSFADEINGIYEWTDNMMEGGMPLYKKKQSEDELIVQYDEEIKSWMISKSDSRGTGKCYATLFSEPALTPDNCPEGNWKTWDDEIN
jgi:hypothetical protein